MDSIPSKLPQLPPRDPASHKGDCGRVLLIAGSYGMAGAVVLAAEGALRSGAGYVEVACAARLVPSLTKAIPAAILHACGEDQRETLHVDDIPDLLGWAEKCQSVVIGPGLGDPGQAAPWIPQLLNGLQEEQPHLPIVLDADGLNHFAAAGLDWSLCSAQMILTPHPGEAARLLQLENAQVIQADRKRAMQKLTELCAATILLKGAHTLIGCKGEETTVNSSGNVGMATAGSGDVLSGHLGALLAAGLPPFAAARLGAYLHGRAGDMFAQEWGTDGLTASDLALWISKAMSEWRATSC
ncbi:MAG: NAD(P)H-hydrate dehydratase [Planctomycetota bacterium]|nr:NAD(P)H-hydrate dehydratase [Planctomycetota bacterium]MDA1113873.1 NAD(P)H-hydrate dehydratase [Planctomycetota bacterium]